MDKYSNWIYLTPMVLGALASIFAAAWRFLGIEQLGARRSDHQDPVRPAAANREVNSDAELTEIENQVDAALDAEMANAIRSENLRTCSTLVSLANRLEDAIHRRRRAIAARPRGGRRLDYGPGRLTGPVSPIFL